MTRRFKAVLVGGGSVTWSPTLMNDLLLKEGLDVVDYVIHDLDPRAGGRMADVGIELAEARSIGSRFTFDPDPVSALADADFIIITISTGDFAAMETDLSIPEEYGIFQTVGDTVGPGGWARSLRNIPVFAGIARLVSRVAPKAVVLNYTNPMATLTKTLATCGLQRVVGLCHGLFGCYDMLSRVFALHGEDEIKVRIAGTNHFFWITEMDIRGEDGYPLLAAKVVGSNLDALIREAYRGDPGYDKSKLVTAELFEHFGYLPFMDDRHICEFLPWYLTGDEERLRSYHLRRTTVNERRQDRENGWRELPELIRDLKSGKTGRSREAAADIIAAFVNGTEYIDVLNQPNIGQVGNLPMGSVVETLGVVNRRGFSPIASGNLPEPLLNLVLPHVRNQDMIVDAGLSGNLELAMRALYCDPLCSRLGPARAREMGMRMLRANRHLLPQFEGL